MKRIEILREAHKLLRKREYGICLAIIRVFCNNRKINKRIITISDIPDYFPLFTLENAKKFGAIDNAFWWPKQSYGLFSGRRRFMRWLMRQYKNDKEEII